MDEKKKLSNEATKFPMDKTAQSDAQLVDKFLESIQTLDDKYELKMQNVNSKNDRNWTELQDKFWLENLASFDESANKLEQIGRKEQNDKIDQTLLDYHTLAALHKHKINEYWSASDKDSRKRTILIAVVELGQLHDAILSKLNQSSKTISIIDSTINQSDDKGGACNASYDTNNEST